MKVEEFKHYWQNSPRLTSELDFMGRPIIAEIHELSKSFHGICRDVRGFGSPHTVATINFLLSNFMDTDEHYLEIGTFCGRSLIGGLRDNNVRAFVIDDHIPRGESFDLAGEFDKNITKYNLEDRIDLFRVDYRQFSDQLPTIGLYYFDGPHDRWDSYDGIKMYERFLSDNAIIMVDDTNRGGVMQDVQDWVSESSHAELIDVLAFADGTALIGYQR